MIPQTITINGEKLQVVQQPEDFYRHTGRIFIKRMFLASAGHTCMGHAHSHDHISCLAHGSVLVIADGITKSFKAPAFIDIEAGTHHQFKALEDETVLYCIHDTYGLDPDDLGRPYTP